jgi:hypothetical protein
VVQTDFEYDKKPNPRIKKQSDSDDDGLLNKARNKKA